MAVIRFNVCRIPFGKVELLDRLCLRPQWKWHCLSVSKQAPALWTCFIKKRKWECVEYVESDKYLLSELEQISEIQQIFFFRGATQLFHLLLRTSALQSHRGNYFEFSIKIQHIDNLQAINHKPNVWVSRISLSDQSQSSCWPWKVVFQV